MQARCFLEIRFYGCLEERIMFSFDVEELERSGFAVKIDSGFISSVSVCLFSLLDGRFNAKLLFNSLGIQTPVFVSISFVSEN